MQCRTVALFVSLLAVASASPCRPEPPSTTTYQESPAVSSTSTSTSTSTSAPTSSSAITSTSATPTLPLTGSGTDLVAANASLSLVKIAVGHGLQNYTCVNSSATVKAPGALAVLYDVTDLYPGTPDTGLTADVFDALSAALIWGQDIPLNLQNPDVASPGTPDAPNAQAESRYGAVTSAPFPEPAGSLTLTMASTALSGLPVLGHHYFDAAGSPTFDLSALGLLGSMAKTGDVAAPATADKGVLGTGAVDWLQLTDNGRGLSHGIQEVYRVGTAGGTSQACSELNATAGSVPYTAFYWFYG